MNVLVEPEREEEGLALWADVRVDQDGVVETDSVTPFMRHGDLVELT